MSPQLTESDSGQWLIGRNVAEPFPCRLEAGLAVLNPGYGHQGDWVGRFCDTQSSPRGYFDVCWFSPGPLSAGAGAEIIPESDPWYSALARSNIDPRVQPGFLSLVNDARFPEVAGMQVETSWDCPEDARCAPLLDLQRDPHGVQIREVPFRRILPAGRSRRRRRDVARGDDPGLRPPVDLLHRAAGSAADDCRDSARCDRQNGGLVHSSHRSARRTDARQAAQSRHGVACRRWRRYL